MNGSILYFEETVPAHCSVGIDLFFFRSESGGQFSGIRNVTAGMHVVHVTSAALNTRTGKLVELDGRSVYAVRFSLRVGAAPDVFDADGTEIEVVRVDWHSLSGQTLGRMVDYERLQVAVDWQAFRFNTSVLRFVRNGQGLLRTEDCTSTELQRLEQEMGTAPEKARLRGWAENELLLSGLEFSNRDKRQLVRLERTGAARTADFLDKSWLVRAVWGGSDAQAVGRAVEELKFAFLGAVVVNNTGCFGQFARIVHLLLHSGALLETPAAAAAVCEFFRFLYMAFETLLGVDVGDVGDEGEGEGEDDEEGADKEGGAPEEGQAGLGSWRRTLLPDIRSFAGRVDSLAGLPLRAQFRWGQLQTLLGLAGQL